MAGINGREVAMAYAVCNTWGVAASVTQQFLAQSAEGLDAEPQLVDDESFGQDWLGAAEVGDHTPRTPELTLQARFEDMDQWFAAALGSPATPTYVSSQGDPTSLVGAEHVITLAPKLEHMFTLATALGEAPTYQVKEVTSLVNRGFTFSVGENGRIMVGFPIVGNKTVYDSTVNTNSTVFGATAATLGNRLFRKNMRVRMNLQGDGALGASDELSGRDAPVIDFTLDMTRPLADADFPANQDHIMQPCDNGFAEFPLQFTFGLMNTVTANSLVTTLAAGGVFKCDIRFLGPYINSATQRTMLLEMPALQIYSWEGVATGHEKIRPIMNARLKKAATSPTGMAFVDPLRMTLTNANSVPMLT